MFIQPMDELLVHLTRPNSVWTHLEAAAEVRMTAIGDWKDHRAGQGDRTQT